MSRSQIFSITAVPRVSLAARLRALATQAPILDLAGGDLAVSEAMAQLPSAADFTRQANKAIERGQAELMLAAMPPALTTALAQVGGDGTVATPADVLRVTAAVLRQADRLATAEALESSLGDLGLTTASADGLNVHAVHGQLGAQHVLGVVHDGELELDVMGCEGTTCSPWLEDIVARVRTRGIELRITHGRTHGDPGGGELIRAAGRQARDASVSLETGAVRAAAGARASRRSRDREGSIRPARGVGRG